MTISQNDMEGSTPIFVRFADSDLIVDLQDGRSISTPLDWYPRLAAASEPERKAWELSAFGIHWPGLDEDLSVSGMLAGRRASGKPASRTEVRFLDRLISLEDYREQKRGFATGNLRVDAEPLVSRDIIERARNEA